MEYNALLIRITRLCAEMISAGGSSEVVPLRMNYICKEYGLLESEFIINSNGVFATATTSDGINLTAIRSIDSIGQNFGKLNRYDEYCNYILDNHPSAEEIGKEIESINSAQYLSTIKRYMASIFLGTGFAALFGCDLKDALVAVVACVVIAFVSSKLQKLVTNIFFNNVVICLIIGTLIIVSAKYLKICTHPESVSMGVIMLLISGLSFSDGLWAMINKETHIGIYKLNSAIIGAIGIVIGIVTPVIIANQFEIAGLSIKAPIFIQVIECIIACAGFAVLCSTDAKHVPAVALGAGLSWIVYAPLSKVIPSIFICMALATFAVTIYSLLVAKKLRINPNITRVVGILPLVPGTNLFYTLYGLATQNRELVAKESTKLVVVCLGISFGFALGRIFIDTTILKIKENASK